MRIFVHIVFAFMLPYAPLLDAANNTQHDQPSATIAVEQLFKVKANDSVWGIASKIARSDVEVIRIMHLLFEQNPTQFIDGNINRLKKGGVLTLALADSIPALTVKNLSDDSSRQDESKKTVFTITTLGDKVPIEKVMGQSFFKQQFSSKKSSIQELTLEPRHPDSEALNKPLNEQLNKQLSTQLNRELLLSHNKATSLIEEVELLNNELKESSQRIKALESSLANKNQVVNSHSKSPSSAPIDAKLVGSAYRGLSSQAPHESKDFKTVMTVSTLVVLLIILIIIRSGVVTRRDVLVASEPAHSIAADEGSALADPVEQYIDEFLDGDVAINTELEIADTPTAEILLDGSDFEPPISKTKLPFISVTGLMDAVDQPATAASVDMSDFNSTATQLQLSRIYIDMGDLDGAKIMLEKVLATADTQQLAIANDLISELEQLS